METINPHWKRLGSVDEGEALSVGWDGCGRNGDVTASRSLVESNQWLSQQVNKVLKLNVDVSGQKLKFIRDR